MKPHMQRLLFWGPRILCLLFAGFISLFALDVFGDHQGFLNTVIALVMHLIPTGILLLILALSWRWEGVGSLVFTALGAAYLMAFWGRFHWSAYVVISGSLFLLAILFLLGWTKRSELRARP